MVSFFNLRTALISSILLAASTTTGWAAERTPLMTFASPANTWAYTNSLGRTDLGRAAMASALTSPTASSQLQPSNNRSVFSPTLAPPYSGWGEINPIIAVYPRYANGHILSSMP